MVTRGNQGLKVKPDHAEPLALAFLEHLEKMGFRDSTAYPD